MAPSGAALGVLHRARRAHPLRPAVALSFARLERAPADQLRRYQERRLRALVALVASRSPYYRRWFRESSTDPRSIRGLADLPRLPLLDRHVLQERPDDFLVYPRRAVWPARSSGSSGVPVTVYRTPGSSVVELSALERQWGWFGVRRGARRVVVRQGPGGGALLDEVRGAGLLRVAGARVSPATLPQVLAAVRRFGAEVVEGWPSALALLAALAEEAGERVPVRLVVTSSEVLVPEVEQLLRRVFDAPVADHYGQTERVALVGSCEAGGYHAFSDYGIVELLPTGGGRAEVVGTALHNWGFPLLRYRTGDEVEPAPAGPCPCGRAFPRSGRVVGRTSEVFTAADGRPVPMPVSVLENLSGLREMQFVQHAPGRFELRLVPGPGFDRAAVEARVRRQIEEAFGAGQAFELSVLDRVPRSASGKLRRTMVLGGSGPTGG